MVGRAMIPEAPLEQTEHGLVCKGDGWFVLNAREARWRRWDGLGHSMGLQGDTDFPQIGIGLSVLGPGEPMYHWESDQEDFLVLAGEATLIVEGQERRLRQWDFGLLQGRDEGGAYTVDETAIRSGAGVERETIESDEAYARFPARKPTRYGGWLDSL
jgi:hypothetical protein